MNTDSHKNNKRIAKNTFVLYFRMLFIMAVTLYTSRVVLNALGFEDYGIYNAVGGFVTMFGVMSNSLTAAISRFITYVLGTGDQVKLKKVFSTSLMIQGALAVLLFILLETAGIWFLNYHMTIPDSRILAANYVMQFSIVTFMVQLISVPYNAAIIAHEHMSAYAIISILNTVGVLVVAFIVKLTTSVDHLIVYSLLLAVVALCIRFIYGWYCSRNFCECNFKLTYDIGLIKEITSFAGWNFFGASSAVLRDQGINVLLNVYCGPVVNAARGIAMQVSSAVQSFSGSFTSALNPQITKQYASDNIDYTFKLCFVGARFSFYLLLLLSMPIFMEAPKVLEIWLVKTPPHCIHFVRLIIVYVMIEAISGTLITLMLATGKIKMYQIVVGGTQLLNFPVAFLLLYLGTEPEYTIVATIVIAVFCMIFRLMMLRSMVKLPVCLFIKEVLINAIGVTLLSAFLPFLVVWYFDSSILRCFTTIFISVCSTVFVIYFVGCTSTERKITKQKLVSLYKKYENRKE